MGIAVGELLQIKFFKSYNIIAGAQGLNRQIQGVAVFDAPDGYHWAKRHEFIVTSGYVFAQNKKLFEEFIGSEIFAEIACFGIKIGRFIHEVPSFVIEAFERANIPLLIIDNRHSWMEIISAVNASVMNQNISFFNLDRLQPYTSSNVTFQDEKISKILSALENGMGFPAMLYDLQTGTSHYSSEMFCQLSGDFKSLDFWNPSCDYSKEILCTHLHMARYRIYSNDNETPFSWILVPITVNDKTCAHFIVLEAFKIIDHLDEFALRTGFLLIQEIFEQALMNKLLMGTAFKNFVEMAIGEEKLSMSSIEEYAYAFNLNASDQFYVVTISVKDKVSLGNYRIIEQLERCIQFRFSSSNERFTHYKNNGYVILIKQDKNQTICDNIRIIEDKLNLLHNEIITQIEGISLEIGFSDQMSSLYEFKKNYQKAEKAMTIGRLLLRDVNHYKYSNLGPFAWMTIDDAEFSELFSMFNEYQNDESGRVLLETFKVYLDSQMNYSLTAQKQFLHINTVRSHIAKVLEHTKIDLDDSFIRLKIQILLHLA